jgi:hypothetical protein
MNQHEQKLFAESLVLLTKARNWVALYQGFPGHGPAADCMVQSIDKFFEKVWAGEAQESQNDEEICAAFDANNAYCEDPL